MYRRWFYTKIVEDSLLRSLTIQYRACKANLKDFALKDALNEVFGIPGVSNSKERGSS